MRKKNRLYRLYGKRNNMLETKKDDIKKLIIKKSIFKEIEKKEKIYFINSYKIKLGKINCILNIEELDVVFISCNDKDQSNEIDIELNKGLKDFIFNNDLTGVIDYTLKDFKKDILYSLMLFKVKRLIRKNIYKVKNLELKMVLKKLSKEYLFLTDQDPIRTTELFYSIMQRFIYNQKSNVETLGFSINELKFYHFDYYQYELIFKDTKFSEEKIEHLKNSEYIYILELYNSNIFLSNTDLFCINYNWFEKSDFILELKKITRKIDLKKQ